MSGRIIKGLVLSLLLASAAAPAGRNFGVGLIVGEPTALSAKLWTSRTTALDFGVGWGLGWGYGRYDNCRDFYYYERHRNYCDDRGYYYDDQRYGYRGLHLHMDYLMHNFDLIRSSERFPLYYGPGVSANFWDRGGAQVGVRGVLGLAWMPRTAPFDVFLEIAPVVQLIPGTWLDINGGIGARFYF
jgi:hypothetical protein